MIALDVWLYGPLARYGGDKSQGSHAHLQLEMPLGTRMSNLLDLLAMPLEEKGITFVNAQLTDMPGLAADLDMELRHGDRIGFFHQQSMWPFQYRFGASLSSGLKDAMQSHPKGGLRHSSAEPPSRAGSAEGDEGRPAPGG